MGYRLAAAIHNQRKAKAIEIANKLDNDMKKAEALVEKYRAAYFDDLDNKRDHEKNMRLLRWALLGVQGIRVNNGENLRF